MAEITVARIVGDWRRVVGDEIVTHETPEIGDAGIHGTVTLTPVWAKSGPYGVVADPAAHYSIHPVVCRVRYGRLYDPTNTHPYEDVVVEIGGHPLVWSAQFDLTFRHRTGEPEVPLQVRGATFDSSAMVAGQVSLTGILPTSAVPDEYQSYFADAAVSAGLAEAARSSAELAAAAADVSAGVASAKADAAAASMGLAEAAADRAVGLSTAQDEHVAGVLEDPDSATHAAFKAVGNATYDRIDVGPSGSMASDKANVIAAALAAKNAGRDVVRLAPGHYLLDGLTPTDVHDRKLVGDGVTFTPTTWLYPFSSNDMTQQAANAARGAGGRGRIAFEVDDGLRLHWTSLFPLCKRLGITMGTAWHTANGAQWIHEAYRHGWEVIAHLPEDITAVVHRNNGVLDAKAQETLDAIVAITGNPNSVGFVYPQHVRDLDTDRILSKYFTRGRGRADGELYPRDSGHPWLVSAKAVDPEFTTGHMSQNLKYLLDRIAANDTQMVFYIHWSQPNIDAGHPQALTEMVAYCRELGIEIVNPAQIWRRREVLEDRYFENTTRWTTNGIAAWDTDQKYHGTRSAKFTAPEAALGNGFVQSLIHELPTRPGAFGVYRMSYRRKNAQISGIGQANGFNITVSGNQRRLTGDGITGAGSKVSTQRRPLLPGNGTLPAGDWVREQELVYLPPRFVSGSFRLAAVNLPAGSTVNVDEFQVQHVGWASSYVAAATLNGTSNVFVILPVANLMDQPYRIEVVGKTVGTVSLTPYTDNGFLAKSTDATDIGQQVRIVVEPGLPFTADSLTSDGA